eukprot:ctg_1545.g435
MNGSRGNGQRTRHDSSRCPRCARLQGTGWALVREDALPPDVEPGTICVLNCRAVCLVWTTPKREEDSLPAWHYDETVVRDGRCVADNVETAAAHSSPLYSTALSDVSIRCLGACRPARHIVLQRCAPASSPPDTPFGWERAVRADLLFLPVMRGAVVSRRWRVFDISGSDNWVAPSTRISVAPAETPPPPPELARGRASAITAPTLDTPLARRLAQCLSQPRCQLQAMGARAIRGVLLCGPPGVGKTHTVGQVVRALRMPLKEVSADATAGTAAAARLHQAYHEAAAAASSADAPAAILFIDELDRLCPKRRDVVGGIDAAAATALLLTIMDGVGSAHPRLAHRVMVVGATNDPDGVDEALRRPGRFDEEIHIAAPTEQERRRLLEALGAAPEEAARLATQTPGAHARPPPSCAGHGDARARQLLPATGRLRIHRRLRRRQAGTATGDRVAAAISTHLAAIALTPGARSVVARPARLLQDQTGARGSGGRQRCRHPRVVPATQRCGTVLGVPGRVGTHFARSVYPCARRPPRGTLSGRIGQSGGRTRQRYRDRGRSRRAQSPAGHIAHRDGWHSEHGSGSGCRYPFGAGGGCHQSPGPPRRGAAATRALRHAHRGAAARRRRSTRHMGDVPGAAPQQRARGGPGRCRYGGVGAGHRWIQRRPPRAAVDAGCGTRCPRRTTRHRLRGFGADAPAGLCLRVGYTGPCRGRFRLIRHLWIPVACPTPASATEPHPPKTPPCHRFRTETDCTPPAPAAALAGNVRGRDPAAARHRLHQGPRTVRPAGRAPETDAPARSRRRPACPGAPVVLGFHALSVPVCDEVVAASGYQLAPDDVIPRHADCDTRRHKRHRNIDILRAATACPEGTTPGSSARTALGIPPPRRTGCPPRSTPPRATDDTAVWRHRAASAEQGGRQKEARLRTGQSHSHRLAQIDCRQRRLPKVPVHDAAHKIRPPHVTPVGRGPRGSGVGAAGVWRLAAGGGDSGRLPVFTSGEWHARQITLTRRTERRVGEWQ